MNTNFLQKFKYFLEIFYFYRIKCMEEMKIIYDVIPLGIPNLKHGRISVIDKPS